VETTIGNQDMQVGVKSEWKIPERLYGDNSTGYRLYHLLTKPLAELHHPLLMTGWTEMATLARKCQEIFMTTVLTSDPGKAIFQRYRYRIIDNA